MHLVIALWYAQLLGMVEAVWRSDGAGGTVHLQCCSVTGVTTCTLCLSPSWLQVCVEYDDSDSQQWVCLVNSTFIQAVYIEDCLVWAKRILVHRPSGVAWPARAFKLLAGQPAHAAGTIVIEYLMDAERSTVPMAQIKELTVWGGVGCGVWGGVGRCGMRGGVGCGEVLWSVDVGEV